MKPHNKTQTPASQQFVRLLIAARHDRCRVDEEDLSALFVGGVTSLPRWLSQPGVELAEDIVVRELGGRPGALIGKPLRVEMSAPAGSLVLVLRPLSSARHSVKMWTSPAAERLDYFQIVNQRLQNYCPQLRRMPGTYDLDTWTKEEWEALAPTDVARFRLTPEGWSTLVVTWGPDGYHPRRTITRAWINGVAVAEGAGILHKLLIVFEDIRGQHMFEAAAYWHRMALLCGVAVSHCALIRKALEPAQAQTLSQADWHDAAALIRAIGEPHVPEPTLADVYANAPGARARAIACEPLENTLPLEMRKADRFRYWNYEARAAVGGQCLSCIPDNTPVRWTVDVPESGKYAVALHYELMMPPAGVSPAVTLQVDGVSPGPLFARCPLPFTTASGTTRPEADRFKPVALAGGRKIELTAGRHELALTFHDNCFLILDEILLTPLDFPSPPAQAGRLAGYLRPPFMAVRALAEQPDASVYTLAFSNAENGPVAGVLFVDASSDPGLEPRLSERRLDFQSGSEMTEATLTVPLDAAGPPTRRIRLIFAEDEGLTRQSYFIRHRRPFETPQRPVAITDPSVAGYPMPTDEAGRGNALADLLQDPSLAAWRARPPDEILAAPPPLHEGHGAAAMRNMALLTFLSRDRKHAANLRALLLGTAGQVAQALPANEDGEKRADVRGDYGGARRGSIFGEVWPEDVIAYDVLLSMGMLSREDQLAIEGNLFWSGYENSARFLGKDLFYRGQAHNIITAAMLGVVTHDAPMLEDVERALIRYGAWQIHPDGGHNEKISSYGASTETLVRLALFLADHGRPKVLQEQRETIRQVCLGMVRGCFSDGSLLRQGDGGIQRSFHIMSGHKLIEYGLKLFPEEPEFKTLKEYSDCLLKRLHAKWEHKPVAEWPEFPDRLLRKSDLFPDSGWAILRSGPGRDRMEVSLDWSAMGDHGHPDKLNVVLFAFDEVLSMDLAYGWSPDTHLSEGYAMRTMSHNTVAADMSCQLPGGKGRLWLFDHQDDAQVVWGDAGTCYQDGIRADRCLVLLGDTVVDFFHLSSGRIHGYDWIFHCLGHLKSSLDFAPRGPLSPALRPQEKVADYPGYDVLTNLRQGGSDTDVHFSWRLDGYPQMAWSGATKRWMAYDLGTLHLDILGDKDSAYIVGDAPFPMPKDDSTRPFVMARRAARDALFVSVFQARSGQGPVARVEAVPVTLRGKILPVHQAAAVRIIGMNRTVTVLQRHVRGPLSAGAIRETDAETVILAQGPNGKLHSVHAYGATCLNVEGAEPWRANAPQAHHLRNEAP